MILELKLIQVQCSSGWDQWSVVKRAFEWLDTGEIIIYLMSENPVRATFGEE